MILRWPGLQTAEIARRIARLAACRPRPALASHGRFDLAVAYGLEGVHLTEASLPPDVVRPSAAGLLVGVSRHDVEGLAAAAGADYATLSCYAVTSSKPGQAPWSRHAFARACEGSRVPVVALGGIGPENAAQAISDGAEGVAVMSAVFSSPRPKVVLRELRAAVDAALRSRTAGE